MNQQDRYYWKDIPKKEKRYSVWSSTKNDDIKLKSVPNHDNDIHKIKNNNSNNNNNDGIFNTWDKESNFTYIMEYFRLL